MSLSLVLPLGFVIDCVLLSEGLVSPLCRVTKGKLRNKVVDRYLGVYVLK